MDMTRVHSYNLYKKAFFEVKCMNLGVLTTDFGGK